MYIIIVFLYLILDFIIVIIRFNLKYAQSPLDIKTFDGFNQPYHPSVLFFKEKWNDFYYWMVQTPYPMGVPYKDRWECPCVYCSNDGINWGIPENLVNPLDDLNEEEIKNKDFFSDPHLVFRNNVLECWYRLTNHSNKSHNTMVLRKRSQNGTKWGDREILINPKEEHILSSVGDMVRSPAIIFQDSLYKMWYVDNKENVGIRNICYSTSFDGFKWQKKINCNLSGKEINPWHIDVSFIEGTYYLLIYDFNDLSLWKSSDGINFSFVKILLTPSYNYGCFYSQGLYRSVLIKNELEYLCFFSAYDEKSTYIGLMKGPTPKQLKVYSSGRRKLCLEDSLYIYIHNRKRVLYNLKEKIKRML